MENNGNQNLASSLCKAGCGFFGNAQYDGMCSKCYKDFVKRKQATPTDSSTSIIHNGLASSSTSVVASPSVPTVVPNTTPSVETGSTTIASISNALSVKMVAGTDANTPSPTGCAEELEDSAENPSKLRKRNRCFTCRKKVGLTGFECRCGGVYCSVHRYSDKHDCQFDYKEHGAENIRKNNPLVVGSKVQKL